MCSQQFLLQYSLLSNLFTFGVFSSVQSSSSSVRPGAPRALVRRLPHRPPMPGERCHNDRNSQLRPHGRQDLRRRPGPDGKHQLLPPRCLQNHISEVKAVCQASLIVEMWTPFPAFQIAFVDRALLLFRGSLSMAVVFHSLC